MKLLNQKEFTLIFGGMGDSSDQDTPPEKPREHNSLDQQNNGGASLGTGEFTISCCEIGIFGIQFKLNGPRIRGNLTNSATRVQPANVLTSVHNRAF